MASNVEDLLVALEERASTARTIFMLLDSDADGLVAVEQVRGRLRFRRRDPPRALAHDLRHSRSLRALQCLVLAASVTRLDGCRGAFCCWPLCIPCGPR